jgi:hypothetical protein
MSAGFTREVRWLPGHAMDGKFGRASLQCRMILSGPVGSVEFRWRPGPTPERVRGQFGDEWMHSSASGSHVGFHFDQPATHQLGDSTDECDIRASGRCYWDASYNDSDRVLAVFLSEGEEAMWTLLQLRYAQWAEDLVDVADLWAI